MKKTLLALSTISALTSASEVYFIEPTDGDKLNGNVKVVFGLSGFGVAPAGIKLPNTGHHHLLINAELPPDMSLPIRADFNHRHFGLGQTETVLTLDPGTYKLQLLMANYLHIPHEDPIYSEVITITVE